MALPQLSVTERLQLTEKIGRELQTRFGYNEIDQFLMAYGIAPPTDVTVNSKRVYAKRALQGVPVPALVKIGRELGVIESPGRDGAELPRNWQNNHCFRLFISHISQHKKYATRLKECLSPYGIAGFVAHEDIHPTLEWQDELERALHTMDAFLAIHTTGFSKSIWTQQEIGFALGRRVKVISFKMHEDPAGFISKRQALPWRNRPAEEVAKEVLNLLETDELTSSRLDEARKTSVLSKERKVEEEVPF